MVETGLAEWRRRSATNVGSVGSVQQDPRFALATGYSQKTHADSLQTALWTNGTGQYALTAQEDNATFEAMMRATTAGLMDFSRVILMRTASDFDRGYAGSDALTAFEASQGGFTPATENIFIVGNPIVQGIVKNWNKVYKKGVAPQDGFEYSANIFHSLSTTKTKKSVVARNHIAARGKEATIA